MSDQSKLGLGHIITTPQNRDAVHVAVAPCIAGQPLAPGHHVGLIDGKAHTLAGQKIGVVDPFLMSCVGTGETFWLFLYPGTITSLRHEWAHQAFDVPTGEPVKPTRSKRPIAKAAPTAPAPDESRTWLMVFAETNADGMSYGDLMEAAERYVEHGDYLIQGGRFEGMHVPDEFWDHYAKATGKPVGDRGSFFSCSC